MMEAQLCGTKITGQMLQAILSKSKEIDIGDHVITAVDAEILGDQGYTSVVLRVKLSWSGETNGRHLPKSVVVKAVGSDAIDGLFDPAQKGKLDEMKKSLFKAHNVECSIYELEGLQNVVPMPRCYGSIRSDDKIIVLEDLQHRGVLLKKTVLFGRGPNSKQFDSLLESLAILHAWSVNTKVDWQTTIPTLADNSAIAELAETTRDSLPKIKKEFPELFKDLDDDKMKNYLTKENFLEIFGCDPKKKYGLPMVLVHGDVQPLNMLFEKNQDGKDGDRLAALLDWQIAHPGCGVEDLARMMGLCMTHEDRRGRGDKVVERYVELFNQNLDNPANQITFGNVKRALDEMLAFLGLMFCFAVKTGGNVADRMNDLTEEERNMIKSDIVERFSENYKEAMKILGWASQ